MYVKHCHQQQGVVVPLEVSAVCEELIHQVEFSCLQDDYRALYRAHGLAMQQLSRLYAEKKHLEEVIAPITVNSSLSTTLVQLHQELQVLLDKDPRIEVQRLRKELQRAHENNELLASELAASNESKESLERKLKNVISTQYQRVEPSEETDSANAFPSLPTNQILKPAVTAPKNNPSPRVWSIFRNALKTGEHSEKLLHENGNLQSRLDDYEAKLMALQSTKEVLLDKLREAERALAVALDQRNQSRAQAASDREVMQYLDIRSQELEMERDSLKVANEALRRECERLKILVPE